MFLKIRPIDARRGLITLAAVGMTCNAGMAMVDHPLKPADHALVEEARSSRLVLQVGPGIEPFTDAEGGIWFLPVGVPVDVDPAIASRVLRNALDSPEVLELRELLTVPAAQAELASKHGLDRFFVVEMEGFEAAEQMAERLDGLIGFGGILEHVEIDGLGGIAAVPDDEFFAQQYGLQNTGQNIFGQTGIPAADISVMDAWSFSIGNPDITVAILDSGVNEHVEFEARLLDGRNIPDNNNLTTDECSSHGTHVTGILSASGNNEIGIAGVAWGVEILPVVVVDGCSGFESWCAEGIIWAADQGADIINMSLQYSTGGAPLQAATAYAYDLGVIQVASTGNTGMSDDVQAPARFPETIAVGALDNRDQRWSDSSQGPEIDVAAAGWRVLSCTNTASYGYLNGTSMSAPLVSGIAALMKSLVPELSPDSVKVYIRATAEDIGAEGFDAQTGAGRPDAYAAILALDPDPPLAGDLNLDGHVDGQDFGILLASWGSCGDCEESPCEADLDGNCVVNGIDIGLLLVDWTP